VSSTRKVAAKPSKALQQLSFRNKMLRGVVWVFLAVFVLSVVGVAVVTLDRPSLAGRNFHGRRAVGRSA